jgi:hypothetical protein
MDCVVSQSADTHLNFASCASGMSYPIPPGHDAWVRANEPFVAIEVVSAGQYAKP